MTGVQVVLGALAGVAAGVAITVLRWLAARVAAPARRVPPSPEVLGAERTQLTSQLTDRRTP